METLVAGILFLARPKDTLEMGLSVGSMDYPQVPTLVVTSRDVWFCNHLLDPLKTDPHEIAKTCQSFTLDYIRLLKSAL